MALILEKVEIIELFHNFTLIHDDIMDAASLRRGMETVHKKYGSNTALLSGDVMLLRSYDYLNQINTSYLSSILSLFNKTAKEVCEGQQLDMDFEQQQDVLLEDYIQMNLLMRLLRIWIFWRFQMDCPIFLI